MTILAEGVDFFHNISACTSGRFGIFYVSNWLLYAEDRTYSDFPIKSCTPISNSQDVYIGIENLISPPSSESQECVTAVILDKEFIW